MEKFKKKKRWKSSIPSANTRSGADCDSDHELLIAKFRLKLKRMWKTTRPFRYDLNQIPYDSTVEVRNRFKGLDLIDKVPDELWMEVHDIVQETGIKTIPMEKKCKKAKCLSEEASMAVCICDGCSIIVDAVEGICPQVVDGRLEMFN